MVRFPLAAAHRQQGLPRQAERFYLALRHSRPHDAWWAAAQSELWLAERKGQPPKELWTCAAGEPPSRDSTAGSTNRLWQAGNVVELGSSACDDEAWRATVACWPTTKSFCTWPSVAVQAPGVKYDASRRAATARRPSGRPGSCRAADRHRPRLRHVLPPVDRPPRLDGRKLLERPGWNPDWFVAHAAERGNLDRRSRDPTVAAHRPVARPPAPLGRRHPARRARRRLPILDHPAAPEIVPEGLGLLLFQ